MVRFPVPLLCSIILPTRWPATLISADVVGDKINLASTSLMVKSRGIWI